MSSLGLNVFESHEIIGLLRGTCQVGCSGKTQSKQIKDKSVILENKRGELETVQYSVGIRMVHVFVRNYDVVFASHVVGQVMVHYQPQ